MKLFSVEEANALIPKVRRNLLELQAAHKAIVSLQPDARRAALGAEHGGGGMSQGVRYIRLLERISKGANKLDELGIQIKDYGRGLIDFPSMRAGKVVLLCWQLGESDEISWWHEVEAGFAGRQPLG
jgi:hypothetical protein